MNHMFQSYVYLFEMSVYFVKRMDFQKGHVILSISFFLIRFLLVTIFTKIFKSQIRLTLNKIFNATMISRDCMNNLL